MQHNSRWHRGVSNFMQRRKDKATGRRGTPNRSIIKTEYRTKDGIVLAPGTVTTPDGVRRHELHATKGWRSYAV